MGQERPGWALGLHPHSRPGGQVNLDGQGLRRPVTPGRREHCSNQLHLTPSPADDNSPGLHSPGRPCHPELGISEQGASRPAAEVEAMSFRMGAGGCVCASDYGNGWPKCPIWWWLRETLQEQSPDLRALCCCVSREKGTKGLGGGSLEAGGRQGEETSEAEAQRTNGDATISWTLGVFRIV